MKNTEKRSPKKKYLWHKPGFETLCIVLASPHFSLIADKKDFFYTFQLENYTIMRFDVTTRQFVPVMHVQASLRRGSIRLDHAAARVPLPFLSLSHIRTNEYERERSQIEKRRETNTRYTRRRHLQKVEKQERKRAVFCTIVKSTDGREIDDVASANLRREKWSSCTCARGFKPVYSTPAKYYVDNLEGCVLKYSHGHDLQRQLPLVISSV